MKLLTAPYYALFSLEFYQQVLLSPLKKGLFYLLYLSALVMLLFSAHFAFSIMPRIDAFAEWAATELPPMTWTPEGLVMDAPSPYPMIHPEYGFLAVIDMTRPEISQEEMGDAAVFVTSRYLYMRDGNGGVRVHSLTRPADKVNPDQLAVLVDGDLVRKIYGDLRVWIFIVPVLISFPLILVTKLAEAAVFSLPGFFIARTRRQPLEYSAVFTTACFAVTAATLVEVRWIVPFLAEIPFGFIGSAILTTGYLFFALKKTEHPEIPPAI